MTVIYRLLTERFDGDLTLELSNSVYTPPERFDVELCKTDDLADIVDVLLSRFNELNTRVRRLENKE